MDSLKGKRIFVTGGSRGLGLNLCQSLLISGADVVTTARSKTAEVEALLLEYPERFSFFNADLSDSQQVQALIQQAALITHPCNGFVANAATGTDGLLTLLSAKEVQQSLEMNLISTIVLTQAVLKGMLTRQEGGSLVFISSVCAQHGFKGLSVYGTAKAGLCGFSKNLAREYGERGIRSNVILPGFLETDMTQSLQKDQLERIQRRTALKRLGKTEDITPTILHLLSDTSSYTTGAKWVIDGGMTG